jgi:hypothetical protein
MSSKKNRNLEKRRKKAAAKVQVPKLQPNTLCQYDSCTRAAVACDVATRERRCKVHTQEEIELTMKRLNKGSLLGGLLSGFLGSGI